MEGLAIQCLQILLPGETRGEASADCWNRCGTTGPPWNKLFARWSVGLASYTSFRDIESQMLVANLGSKGHTHVCPDLRTHLNFLGTRIKATISVVSESWE